MSAPPPVPLVCEVAADYVAALRHRQGRLEAWAVRPLPEGAVRPAPLAENIADRAAVLKALEEVLGSVGDAHRRAALLVPDLLARVAVLEFDHLPDRPEEADPLLRWRLSKDLPFDVAQAALSFETRPGRASAHEALVVVCLRSLLRPYEQCLESLGVQPGWVQLSTLAALGCLGSSAAPRLLVKLDSNSLGLALVHGDAVRLFRTVPTAAGGRALREEEVVEKVYPAVVSFQDQWGQAVSEVVLAGALPASLGPRLARELGCAVREFDPGSFELPPAPGSGAPTDPRLTPSLGWVRGEAG